MRLIVDHETNTVAALIPVDDKTSRDLLAAYAKRNSGRDPMNAELLVKALADAGYLEPTPTSAQLRDLMEKLTDAPAGALGFVEQTVAPYRLDLVSLALVGLRNTIELLEAAEAEKVRRLKTGELT